MTVENPREEAAQIFTMVRDTMVNTLAKDLADQVKVAAAIYNGLLMQRRLVSLLANTLRSIHPRGMRLTRIKEQKGARSAARKLLPTTEFLFGGQVVNLANNIKASAELSPLAIDFKMKKKPQGQRTFKGSGARGNFSKYPKFRGGSNARGRGSSSRGSRLDKFKE